MHIRPYQNSDIPAIAKLMGELGYPTSVEQMEKRLASHASAPSYLTWLAIIDNEIAGMIGFAQNFFWERDGFYIRIQVLVVGNDFRRKGVGECLISAVEKQARHLGAAYIMLNSGLKESRHAAHEFYPKMGFVYTSAGYFKELTS
jgi:GNAT superfamily N-acetyltransferase